jgi:hypothetical protein
MSDWTAMTWKTRACIYGSHLFHEIGNSGSLEIGRTSSLGIEGRENDGHGFHLYSLPEGFIVYRLTMPVNTYFFMHPHPWF